MRTRMKKLALLISLLALGVLGLVAYGGGDGATEVKASADTTTATARPDTTTEAKPSREIAQEARANLSRKQRQELKRQANEWASLFAEGGCNNKQKYMGQPMCERLACKGIKNCTPVSAAFEESFAGATVDDIKSVRILHVGWTDHPVFYAAVKFSNGEVVVFNGGGKWYSCAGPGSGCTWNVAEPKRNRRFVQAAAPRE
jgi:hypothetical protein